VQKQGTPDIVKKALSRIIEQHLTNKTAAPSLPLGLRACRDCVHSDRLRPLDTLTFAPNSAHTALQRWSAQYD
jgi:hypothetical protein